MGWVDLYIAVEGKTELQFAKEALAPHLAQFQCLVYPHGVESNKFVRWNSDLNILVRTNNRPNVWVTTMVDFYQLGNDFPEREQAQTMSTAAQKVQFLEQAWHTERGNDPRFIPYIQLHEFESLLYCGLPRVSQSLPGNEKGFKLLEAEVAGLAPEEINHGVHTSPSKRLIRFVPAYKKAKVRVGAAAAVAIGLPTLRTMCPHFGEWLTKLEQLAS